MKHSVFIFSFVSILFTRSFGQRSCGTAEYMSLQLKQQPDYAANLKAIEIAAEVEQQLQSRNRLAQVTLPVVFHVVYNSAAQNVSDAKINEQLDILNKDFRKLNFGIFSVPQVWQGIAADCEINFCLAKRDPNGVSSTGITRSQTAITAFGLDDKVKKTSLGGTDIWDPTKYINIWVCPLASNVLGYTPYPGGNPQLDGVVLDYRVIGKSGPIAGADSGHTATHEMGHYFNLRHIWADDAGCDSSDYVADTPNQGGSTFGCPTFPKTDACSPNAPGIMFMNFMDYSDDACLAMFTQGQKARMQAMLDPLVGARKSLLTSNGCEEVVGLNSFSLQEMQLFYTETPGIYRVGNTQQVTHIKLFDLLGRDLQPTFDIASKTIDISVLPIGIYVLRFYNERAELISVQKIIR
jgi:hypothetical protein